MNINNFVFPELIPALSWLWKKSGWFRCIPAIDGIRDLDIDLPAMDKDVDPKSYFLLSKWIKGCHTAILAGEQGAGELGRIYVYASIVGEGSKVFFPTHMQCEAMMNVELDVPRSYYRQPYRTFIVKFPHTFVKQQSEQANTKRWPTWSSATHVAEKNLLMSQSTYHAADGTTNIGSLHLPGTLEELLTTRGIVTGEESEYVDNETSQRIMLNFALMLTNFKHLLQYKDKQQADAIQRRIDSKPEPLIRRGLAQRKHWLVQEILPEQNTKFYDTLRTESVPGKGGHASPKPHWRRGHWRREAGFRDILATGGKPKITFIRPVLVNGSLIDGPVPAISVNYQSVKAASKQVSYPNFG